MRYRLNKIFRNSLLSLAWLISAVALGQEERYLRVRELFQKNQYDSALVLLDSVILHPQTKNDPEVWTTRAFIYYKIYLRNNSEKFKRNSALRDSTVSSLKVSESLKPDSTNRENNKRLYKEISKSYHKIAKVLVEDSLNYEKSQEAFGLYKFYYKKVDPGFDFKEREIEYYKAVGSFFSDVFNKDNKNTKAGDIAKVALLKVLEMNPNDVHANLNLGLMYYNQAVVLVQSLEAGEDFAQIDIIQDNMIKLAKQSLHLINTVYTLEPENHKAMQALFYIYRMLNDIPKHEEFKVKCRERGIDIGEKKSEPLKENSENKDPNQPK